MSLFGLIKRSKPRPAAPTEPVMVELPAPGPVSEPMTPSQLRQMLFDAIVRQDELELARLCDEHREMIRAHASDWMDVPHVLHANPAAAEWYARGVRLLAQRCTPAAA